MILLTNLNFLKYVGSKTLEHVTIQQQLCQIILFYNFFFRPRNDRSGKKMSFYPFLELNKVFETNEPDLNNSLFYEAPCNFIRL